MQWHGHQAILPFETLLESAWGLLEGFGVPLEGLWTVLGGLLAGSREVFDMRRGAGF